MDRALRFREVNIALTRSKVQGAGTFLLEGIYLLRTAANGTAIWGVGHWTNYLLS
jgi:hypothetical protein